DEENICKIGELDYLISYANFTIHCFLGEIKNIRLEDIKPNQDEVDHIFAVPLDYFLTHEPMIFELVLKTESNESFPYELIPKGRDYNFREGKHAVLFYQYGEYIIWGFTARMTKQFIDIMKEIGEL
ncbi:CoA pyrophosphatase, partial [Vibrio parahaemolyticus]|nr:CoA pyrophosphatase [Vibrio parahaemolyticus]